MIETGFHDQRISGALSRLEAVIDAENRAIGTDLNFDLKQSNALKSRCLYDMTMLFKDIRADDLKPHHKDHLKKVQAKLAANSLKVRAHMEAVREITDMIKDTVAAHEADGTYSADQFRGYDLS